MQQQISVVTIGTHDLARSERFYIEGFGWKPVFENDKIIFYQMNGLMLGTFLLNSLETDMNRRGLVGAAAFDKSPARLEGKSAALQINLL